LLLLIVSLWRRLNLLDGTITRLSREIAIQKARKPENKDRDK
jgi:heme exporter protein D